MYDCVRVFSIKTMQKLKLLPSLKEKKRYLVYKVSSSVRNHNQIIDQCNLLLGIFDGAKAGIRLIVGKGSMGIIRVTNTHVNKLRFCLALIEKLEKPIRIDTLYVSGLLDKAKRVMKNG